MTPAEVMVEAILDREWWDHAKAAHRHHVYDSGCAVCRGWVADMVREGLRGLDMAGFSVIADSDLREVLSQAEAFAQQRNSAEDIELVARLRAALPEETTTDER